MDDYYINSQKPIAKTLSTPVKFPLSKKKIEPSFKLPSPAQSPKLPVASPPVFASVAEPKEKLETPPITPPVTPAQSPPTKMVKKKEDATIASMIRSRIPNYSAMSLEEQYKHRSTLRARFELIKESFNQYGIPDLDTMSLEAMHECYEIYLKNINVSENSGKYKVYLVILWLFIEYMCCRMGLDIRGYTMTQLKAMNKYETLLIKLGEKNYRSTFGEEREQWPVEFDILFMALINAVTFIIIKMLCESVNLNEKMAETVMETISTYLSGASPQPGNVLFGGTHQPDQVSSTPQLDIPNILANLGGMFMNKPKPVQSSHHADVPAKTPKFKPAYDD